MKYAILVAVLALPALLQAQYISPSQQTGVPFGTRSQWAQPWRGYLQTVPASTFLNGISLNFDQTGGADPDLTMQHLVKHGIKRIRVEIGWNSIDYADETKIDNAWAIKTLTACAKRGVRPLILLNANSGNPCPSTTVAHTVVASYAAGSLTLTLDSAAGVVPGYSTFGAVAPFITSMNGNVATLSMPFTVSIPAGNRFSLINLKYRPFNAVGSSDYNNTLAGWLRYVKTVSTVASGILGPSGFDLEIWNELSFGSEFLNINNYYKTPQFPITTDPATICNGIKAATAAASSAGFPGAAVTDGFADESPFPAMSTEPAGVDALSKHPYPRAITFPTSAIPNTPLDATGAADTSGWQPAYGVNFIEYYAAALQTEFIERDLGPLGDSIYGTAHGQPVWITEINQLPNTNVPSMDAATSRYLKAKIALRAYLFFIGKGAPFVSLYDATSGDLGYGVLSDAFVSLAAQSSNATLGNDAAVTSPAMAAIGNVVAKMGSPTAAPGRAIALSSVTDTHNHYQFAGNGTKAHPSLYDRDVFAFLPYAVNAKTFVIAYYVQTRDLTHVYTPRSTGGHQYDLPAEQFSFAITGVAGSSASVTAYDPINNVAVPVTVTGKTATSLQLTVSATDYPYLLLVNEASH